MKYKAFDVRRIFQKIISFRGCMYLKHFKALEASIKPLSKCLLHAQNAHAIRGIPLHRNVTKTKF